MEWIEIRAKTRFCALPNLASPPGRPIDRHASPQLTAGALMVSVFVVGNVLWFNATVWLLYLVSLAIVA